LAAAVVVGGVLAVVALAALGSRSVDVPSGKVADTGQVAARFGVAVGIGAVLCALVVAVCVVLGRRDERVASALGVAPPWNTRSFVRRSVPWVIACLALAGVLGAATAPLRDKDTSVARESTGSQPGDPPLDAQGDRAQLGKPRYDGAIVRDNLGHTHVSVDLDGDGQLDATLVPCPTGSPRSNVAPPTDDNGAVLVPIDENCDGTIDGYARLRSLAPVDPGDAPLDGLGSGLNERVTPRATVPPTSTDRLTGGHVAWSRLALVLVVGLGVLLLAYAALQTLLKAPAHDDHDEPPEPDRDDTAAGADESVHASMAILHRVSDPREGIIAAYSQLLDGLAAAGLPRHSYEAPDEYMRRCSERLRLRAEPLRRLTELFTVARFSTHDLNEQHHAAALSALEAVAGDLAAARAPSTAGAPMRDGSGFDA
jgi:hypothetical protein